MYLQKEISKKSFSEKKLFFVWHKSKKGIVQISNEYFFLPRFFLLSLVQIGFRFKWKPASDRHHSVADPNLCPILQSQAVLPVLHFDSHFCITASELVSVPVPGYRKSCYF
jgi:hypothetical protein